MQRRIFGIETEYGVTCTSGGTRRLTPDEVARYLFRRVVSWGRSSNVFLGNGARLYLDVGSHPEYATAECDDIREAVIQDKAGERILVDLAVDAQERMAEDDIRGDIYIFKNNTDSAGNSYGCHENFLVSRHGDFQRVSEHLIPFLISRQITCGAGKIVQLGNRAVYAVSQRADHIWEGVSSATTRSRPIINTRDEPHADAEHYRRLHVIVGDSNMSQTTTQLKLGSAHLVLQMIEEGIPMRDMSLDNPIRAIREMSHDISGRTLVRLANGKEISALAMQTEYFERATAFVERQGISDETTKRVLDLWGRTLTAIETDNHSLVDTEIDWVIKKKLLDQVATKHGYDLDHPRMLQLDLTYHDIKPGRGVFDILQRAGRAATICTDDEITAAVTTPPQTTRAKLRGDFVRAAQQHRRDFTVDWIHLKLNDQAQRTVLVKDPFANEDPRVTALIEAMG
ncbi:Pup--protein ligase [Yimella sp. RIT 621]|uniref:Pup--protein ligase n=1 Tax=Yimella sp. RIT 621 TaxID=2510323 RepID=UPI00101BB3CA|nr:Pup--protein ligase [Yimella sp. RIT 621]RYG76203.1 Pup--protein ligase [Yimella sp. RIT 621]